MRALIIVIGLIFSSKAFGNTGVSIDSFTNIKEQESDQKKGFKNSVEKCLKDQLDRITDLFATDPDFQKFKKEVAAFNSGQDEDQQLILDFRTRLILQRRKIRMEKHGFPYWHTPRTGPYEFYYPAIDMKTSKGMNKIISRKIYNLFSSNLSFYKEGENYCENDPQYPPKDKFLSTLYKALDLAKEKAEQIRQDAMDPSDVSIKQGKKADGKPIDGNTGGDGGGTAFDPEGKSE